MNVTSASDNFLKNCYVRNAKFSIVVAFPSKEYYVNHVICFAVNVLLMFTTIFLNALTVLAYWKSPSLKKKSTYFVVMLLSVNDLGVGVLCNSTFIIRLVKEIVGDEDCFWSSVSRGSTLMLSGMSLMCLLVLCIERYLAITHPVFHRNKVTKRRLLTGIVILWCLSIMSSGVFYISEMAGKVLSCFAIAMFLLTVIFTHIKIFLTIRRSAVQVIPSHGNQPETGVLSALSKKSLLQNVRQAKSCLLVVISTVVCFLPTIITSTQNQGSFKVKLSQMWSMTSVLLISTLNSIVFFWQNRILRNEAKRFLQVFF